MNVDPSKHQDKINDKINDQPQGAIVREPGDAGGVGAACGAERGKGQLDWLSLWASSGLGREGLTRTCATLVYRQIEESEESEEGLFRNLGTRSRVLICLAADLHSDILSAPRNFYVPPEVVLTLSALRLESAAGKNWGTGAEWDLARQQVQETLAKLASIAAIPRTIPNQRISTRFHLDGRLVHQFVQSFECLSHQSRDGQVATSNLSPKELAWVTAVDEIIGLAIVAHFGLGQLDYLRSELRAQVHRPVNSSGASHDLMLMSACMKSNSAGASSNHDHLCRSIFEFHWALTPSPALNQRFQIALKTVQDRDPRVAAIIDFLNQKVPSRTFGLVQNSHVVQKSQPLSQKSQASLQKSQASLQNSQVPLGTASAILNPSFDLPAHIVPGVEPGEFWTCGFFKNMLHRIESRVDASTYLQYYNEQKIRLTWVAKLCALAKRIDVPPVPSSVGPSTAAALQTALQTLPSQTDTTTMPTTKPTTGKKADLNHGGKTGGLRKRKPQEDLALLASMDDSEGEETEHEAMVKRLKADDLKSRAYARPVRSRSKSHKDAQRQNPQTESNATNESAQTRAGQAPSKTTDASTSIAEEDELGRCFVARVPTLQSLTEAWAASEKEPFMFSAWNKRSDVLADLQADDAWRSTGPQWGPLPKSLELDVGKCLSEHLEIFPKIDTVSGKPILNGALDEQSYTDRAMYSSDRTINRSLMERLDLAFQAMHNTTEIVTHREILAFPGLRGYFIDVWRTLVLNGRNAITPSGLAFICAAIVYCMDSKDPADHADYHSLVQILSIYTDRSLAPGAVCGFPCSHKGSTLAKAHIVASFDSVGFGPRLLTWLVKSQRVSHYESDTTATTDRYPLERMVAVNKRARWIEALHIIEIIVRVYLHTVFASLGAKAASLTVLDLLRMTLSVIAHNDTLQGLIQDWKKTGIDLDDLSIVGFLHDVEEHPDGKKPHEIWKLSKVDLKTIAGQVQQSLVRFVGSEANRTIVVQWLNSASKLVVRDASLKQKEKIKLGQLTSFLSATLESLKPSKFRLGAAPVVCDVVQFANAGNTSYKLVYAPNTSKHQHQTIKGDTHADRQRRKTLVNHLANVHKWKFRLKMIERHGEDAALIPQDQNLSNIERKFLNVRLATTLASSLQQSAQQPPHLSVPSVVAMPVVLPGPQIHQQNRQQNAPNIQTYLPNAPRYFVHPPMQAPPHSKPDESRNIETQICANGPVGNQRVELALGAQTIGGGHRQTHSAVGNTGSSAVVDSVPIVPSAGWWNCHLGPTQLELLRMEDERKTLQYLREPILHHVQIHDRKTSPQSGHPPASLLSAPNIICPPFVSLDMATLVNDSSQPKLGNAPIVADSLSSGPVAGPPPRVPTIASPSSFLV